ncbi:hypothetical protein NT6N_36010 [Oceaniferula spumae]|uniref:Sulfatase N-terminal domain-containing protein n=1 Tax=Oceaniferula spumae TaxID=2979115 RepID=A0AAT9FRA7_9BACT
MKNLLFIITISAMGLIEVQSEEIPQKPNILFIAVDDWNDWVGCLGHKQAKTPNVDRLAARGMLFTNASCAAPVCNPSRAAVMSGLRPFTTGVYENATPLQIQLPKDHLTLPKYFRKHGYIAHGSGKIYHDQIGGQPHDDFDHYHFWNEHYRKWGWELGYSRFPDPEPNKLPFAKITSKTKRNFDFGPIAGKETDMPDFKSTSYGIEFLQQKHDKPFFLAIGQFRPHLPWFVPQKYFDMHPLDNIQLPPTNAGDLDDLPKIALKRTNDRASKHHLVKELNEWKKAIQGYLACISFSDHQIGRLLDALDASPYKDNTIIVLWSDHGYHLGEKDHWHKRTLWERSVHVPYIIVAPGITTPNRKTSAPVDLMSIYPTLIELAGLPSYARIQGQGTSVFSLLKNPDAQWPHYALCTHTRGNHSVRSRHYRYIRYQDGSEELYDHRSDPNEWHNIAQLTAKEKAICADHAKHLPKTEAPTGPSYYAGSVLMKLTGDTYQWKLKKEIQGDKNYLNAGKIKSQAWKAAKSK